MYLLFSIFPDRLLPVIGIWIIYNNTTEPPSGNEPRDGAVLCRELDTGQVAHPRPGQPLLTLDTEAVGPQATRS